MHERHAGPLARPGMSCRRVSYAPPMSTPRDVQRRLTQQGADVDALYEISDRIESKVDTLDGRVSALDGKVDQLAESTTGRFDALEQRTDARFDALERTLGQILERLERS